MLIRPLWELQSLRAELWSRGVPPTTADPLSTSTLPLRLPSSDSILRILKTRQPSPKLTGLNLISQYPYPIPISVYLTSWTRLLQNTMSLC